MANGDDILNDPLGLLSQTSEPGQPNLLDPARTLAQPQRLHPLQAIVLALGNALTARGGQPQNFVAQERRRRQAAADRETRLNAAGARTAIRQQERQEDVERFERVRGEDIARGERQRAEDIARGERIRTEDIERQDRIRGEDITRFGKERIEGFALKFAGTGVAFDPNLSVSDNARALAEKVRADASAEGRAELDANMSAAMVLVDTFINGGILPNGTQVPPADPSNPEATLRRFRSLLRTIPLTDPQKILVEDAIQSDLSGLLPEGPVAGPAGSQVSPDAVQALASLLFGRVSGALAGAAVEQGGLNPADPASLFALFGGLLNRLPPDTLKQLQEFASRAAAGQSVR